MLRISWDLVRIQWLKIEDHFITLTSIINDRDRFYNLFLYLFVVLLFHWKRLNKNTLTFCFIRDFFKPAQLCSYPVSLSDGIKSCKYRSSGTFNIYIKHQNMRKTVIPVSLTVAWLLVPKLLVWIFLMVLFCLGFHTQLFLKIHRMVWKNRKQWVSKLFVGGNV